MRFPAKVTPMQPADTLGAGLELLNMCPNRLFA
jgi:hypothetical protein